MLRFPPFDLKHAVLPALAAVFTGSASAQLICYEGFEGYSAGGQVESGSNGSSGTGLDGGAGWGGAYDVSNAIKSLVLIENRAASPVNFTNGEITISGGDRAMRFYDIANGSYAVRRPIGTAFSAAAGDTLWFSILFRTNNVSPLANQDLFQIGFDDSAVTSNPRVSIGAANTSSTFPAPFQFFARSTSAASASTFHSALPIAAATTYLLVGRVQPNSGAYDSVSLWVNPSTLEEPGPPSATITLISGLTTLSHAIIRTVNLDLNDAYVLDECRIGRDYGSVVQSLRHALRILPAAAPGGSPKLRWPASLSGVVLQTSTTLDQGSWSEVLGPFLPYAAESEYTIPINPETPKRFYRLRRF
jgi:hypothetical protein